MYGSLSRMYRGAFCTRMTSLGDVDKKPVDKCMAASVDRTGGHFTTRMSIVTTLGDVDKISQ